MKKCLGRAKLLLSHTAEGGCAKKHGDTKHGATKHGDFNTAASSSANIIICSDFFNGLLARPPAAGGRANPIAGDSDVQLVPSGPGSVPDAIPSLLLTTIYTAQSELIMTTPYFIPDEPLLAALKAAAQRGVDVKIIVPEKNDSLLVQYASRARYEELAESGVKIFLFSGGLLHSKTITVDQSFSLFGSVNLDMRSFWLNFEATLVIYCKSFTKTLLETQKEYLSNSTELDFWVFRHRNNFEKFKENVTLLVAPIL